MDVLTPEERARYQRQVILPGFGQEGQERLKQARVLLVGLGGLGSPVALYLAAAGVGTLGLLDGDVVEAHNLQRQVLHDTPAQGTPKTASARERILALNPHCNVREYPLYLTADNALELFRAYDVIVDGSDNFPTRYLVNDAAHLAQKPLVYGAIFQYEGQVSVFHTAAGTPCYRCLFPDIPPPGAVPNCAEAGVLGALCGIVGSMQAMEVLKLVTGVGETLAGRLLTVDTLKPRYHKLTLQKDPTCPLCGREPSIHKLHTAQYQFTCEAAMTDDTKDTPMEISVAEAQARMNGSDEVLIVDVREDFEYAICKLPGSVLVPLGTLSERLESLQKEVPILTLCHHGIRSLRAAKMLRDKGFEATSIAGGIDAWSRQIDSTVPRY